MDEPERDETEARFVLKVKELLIKPILNVIARSLRSRNPLNNDIVKA